MTISHYELVNNLFKTGEAIQPSITAQKLSVLHATIGISGEAGELLDAVKKHVMYNKPLDVENVIEELGDLYFYMEALEQALGLSKEAIIRHNISKLSIRYSSGSYSDTQAQERADKQDGE